MILGLITQIKYMFQLCKMFLYVIGLNLVKQRISVTIHYSSFFVKQRCDDGTGAGVIVTDPR